jgi:hypothetical protein
MFNLDIFNLPKRYVELEKKLAVARGVGNCQGYITGHNGAEACWALALEHQISINYFVDQSGLEARVWTKNGYYIRVSQYTNYEDNELALRVTICELAIVKLESYSK